MQVFRPPSVILMDHDSFDHDAEVYEVQDTDVQTIPADVSNAIVLDKQHDVHGLSSSPVTKDENAAQFLLALGAKEETSSHTSSSSSDSDAATIKLDVVSEKEVAEFMENLEEKLETNCVQSKRLTSSIKSSSSHFSEQSASITNAFSNLSGMHIARNREISQMVYETKSLCHELSECRLLALPHAESLADFQLSSIVETIHEVHADGVNYLSENLLIDAEAASGAWFTSFTVKLLLLVIFIPWVLLLLLWALKQHGYDPHSLFIDMSLFIDIYEAFQSRFQ
jgi:hypothetical protein